MQEDYDRSFDQAAAKSIEQTFFTKVYTWMTAALLMTATVALFMFKSGMAALLWGIETFGGYHLVYLILFIGQFIFVGILAARVRKLSRSAAIGLFFFYSVLNGVTLSIFFLFFTNTSIASTFFVTAATFGAMSLYGYTTKRSLSSIDGYLIMGLVGVIIASLVNWFLQSPMIYWIITFGVIFVFLGLTAYDTQRLKYICQSGEVDDPDSQATEKLAIYGALQLYLDFINLFIILLRFAGKRR